MNKINLYVVLEDGVCSVCCPFYNEDFCALFKESLSPVMNEDGSMLGHFGCDACERMLARIEANEENY